MRPNETIKSRVMPRIYAVYFTRQILKPFVLEAFFFLASSLTLISTVSISSVIGNTIHLSGIGESFNYLIGAFAHTQTLVQVVSVAFMILALLVAKRLLAQLRSYLTVRVPFMPMAR